ncbi:MAG: heme exporter protein CcmD [Coriobacteriaceae bacterium]|nr:heme exporter protein CcmD [Coriobacteriaceae bacterium]
MDAILAEVYSTVLPAAPYVLAAYIGILLVIAAFVALLWRKSKRTEADIDALERALESREQQEE